MMGKNTLAVLAMLCASGVVHAQDYFDFDSVAALPDQPSVQVDLNGALLGIAAAASRGSDPRMAALLESIEGARLRAYTSVQDAAEIASFVDAASARLEREGWQRVVYAQNEEGNVRIYARLAGDVLNGLTVMAFGEEGAAFVNIAGQISAEQIGSIAELMQPHGMFGQIPQLASSRASSGARD